MFNSISWGQYLTVVITAVVIYYLAVIIIYYRPDIVKKYHQLFVRSNSNVLRDSEEPLSVDNQPGSLPDNVQRAIEDLDILFRTAARQNYLKDELLMALQLKIRSYQPINDPGFVEELTNYILTESARHCNIDFDETDLRRIWS